MWEHAAGSEQSSTLYYRYWALPVLHNGIDLPVILTGMHTAPPCSSQGAGEASHADVPEGHVRARAARGARLRRLPHPRRGPRIQHQRAAHPRELALRPGHQAGGKVCGEGRGRVTASHITTTVLYAAFSTGMLAFYLNARPTYAHAASPSSHLVSSPCFARVLDVGSGTGYVAACAAVLVGQSGSVTSVDVRPRAIEMSEENVRELRGRNPR